MILMDGHMPECDGLEATRLILEYEKLNNIEHTPIVALTANALKDDKERFLSAGMDDYLSKPIQLNELDNVLYKYILSKKEHLPIENIQTIQFDFNKTSKTLGLDLDLIKELFLEFIISSKDDLLSLKNAIESNNFEDMKLFAHKIKGAASNLRVDEIYEISKDIEYSAKDCIDKNYHELFVKLEECFELLENSL
ncbi:MAG: response regulator, partial [Campylobacterales bacterium]|nr:response regulator [Campylobacterales bacterium]